MSMLAGVQLRGWNYTAQIHIKSLAMFLQHKQVRGYTIVLAKRRVLEAVFLYVAELNLKYGQIPVRRPEC